MYKDAAFSLALCMAVIDLLFGIYVLAKDPKSRIHRSFFVLVMGIATWIAGVFLLAATHDQGFITVALWGGELIVIGFVLCAVVFPEGKRITRSFLIFVIPWAVAFALAPYGMLIRSAAVSIHGYPVPHNGPWFVWWAILMGTYLGWGFITMIRHYVRLAGIERVQMKYFLVGSMVFIGGGFLFDIALPAMGIYRFNVLGPSFSLVFVTMVSYAMIRHRFMETNAILARGVFYIAALAVIAGLFFLFDILFLRVVRDWLADPLAMIVSAALFLWIKDLFEKVTDTIFFRGNYRYGDAVRELGPLLGETIRLDKLLSSLADFLERTVRVDKAVFVLKEGGEPFYYFHPARVRPELFVEAFNMLMADCSSFGREPFFFQEIRWSGSKGSESGKNQVFLPAAEKAGIAAIIPLCTQEEAVAVLFLGPKISGDIFRRKDIELLNVVAHQAGMAIENARLYREIELYSEELERRVDARTEEIKAMYESQSQFLTDISHQLQTPLAIFRGNLEVLSREAPGSGQLPIRTISTTLDGMERLVKDLLESARLKFSKNKFYFETVSVGELLEEVHDDCAVLGASKGVRILFSSESVRVAGDRAKIKEVILNLVSNALAHTQFGGKILLEGRGLPGGGEISVTDTGTGIAPENLPRIFDRFYRIRSDRSSGGSGLGLDICKQIIEAHQGTISVESRVGKGTKFTITLPYADAI